MKSKWQNVRGRVLQWGWRRALHWELMSLLSKLGVRVHYVTVGSDMREILGENEPVLPPGYETRMVGLTDLRPYADRTPGLAVDDLELMFGRGDVCAANFFGGDVVGFSFSSFTRARATSQLDVLIPAGFRYGYKSWTHDDHRRANLSRMRGYVRRRTMPFDHDRRSISFVETHNYPSLLHGFRHPRLRSLRMGFVGWITLFGRQIPFASRRARWVGLEFLRTGAKDVRQYI